MGEQGETDKLFADLRTDLETYHKLGEGEERGSVYRRIQEGVSALEKLYRGRKEEPAAVEPAPEAAPAEPPVVVEPVAPSEPASAPPAEAPAEPAQEPAPSPPSESGQ